MVKKPNGSFSTAEVVSTRDLLTRYFLPSALLSFVKLSFFYACQEAKKTMENIQLLNIPSTYLLNDVAMPPFLHLFFPRSHVDSCHGDFAFRLARAPVGDGLVTFSCSSKWDTRLFPMSFELKFGIHLTRVVIAPSLSIARVSLFQ